MSEDDGASQCDSAGQGIVSAAKFSKVRARREAWEALLFRSPWIIGFVLFTGGPIVYSLGLSFYKSDMIRPARFIGFGNYRQMAHDPMLTKSLINTIVYAAMAIPSSICVSLA